MTQDLRPLPLRASRERTSRWSASAWLLVRDGGEPSPLPSPSLSGSQAGIRIAYTPPDAAGLSAFARASAALAAPDREVALGVEWQPGALPVRIVAEHRFALNRGGVDGPGLGIIGGVYDVRLPADFKLEAYGQAGAVMRRRTEAYVDASARAMRTMARFGKTRIELGAGAWGGAQRNADRLDMGPSLGLVTPIADRQVRLLLDWRERIAGDARPDSGPALTLGTDF